MQVAFSSQAHPAQFGTQFGSVVQPQYRQAAFSGQPATKQAQVQFGAGASVGTAILVGLGVYSLFQLLGLVSDKQSKNWFDKRYAEIQQKHHTDLDDLSNDARVLAISFGIKTKANLAFNGVLNNIFTQHLQDNDRIANADEDGLKAKIRQLFIDSTARASDEQNQERLNQAVELIFDKFVSFAMLGQDRVLGIKDPLIK